MRSYKDPGSYRTVVLSTVPKVKHTSTVRGSYPYFHFIAHNKPKQPADSAHYNLAEPQSSPRLLFFPTAWWKNTHRTKILKIHAAPKTNAYHGQTSPSATPLTT
jgi:hypothetical protein